MELNNVEMIQSFPSWATIEESTFYTIEASEANYTAMMKEIGLSELRSVYESGVITENAKELATSFVTWLKRVWGQIKGVINNALDWIDKKIKEFKNKVNAKVLAAAEKKLDRLKSGKKYGKAYTLPGYDDIIDKTGKYVAAVETCSTELNTYFGLYTDKASNYDIDTAKKDVDDTTRKMLTSLGVKVEGNEVKIRPAQINEVVKKAVLGEEVDVTKEYIVSNWADMKKTVTDFNTVKSDVKKFMNTQKKSIEDSIKAVKKITKTDKSVAVYLNGLKLVKQCNINITGIAMTAIKTKFNTAMGVALRLVAAVGKAEAEAEAEAEAKSEKKDGEAAAPANESATFQTELSSLFGWDF